MVSGMEKPRHILRSHTPPVATCKLAPRGVMMFTPRHLNDIMELLENRESNEESNIIVIILHHHKYLIPVEPHEAVAEVSRIGNV